MPSLPLYDGVNPQNVFNVVAGLLKQKAPFGIMAYLTGGSGVQWATDAIMTAKMMTPYVMGIDQHNEGVGDLLDVERGAAGVPDIVGWLEHRRSLTHNIDPGIYVAKDNGWVDAITAVKQAGIRMPPWFIADATGELHLVPGSSATQWAFMGAYDVSITSSKWPWNTNGLLIPPTLHRRER